MPYARIVTKRKLLKQGFSKEEAQARADAEQKLKSSKRRVKEDYQSIVDNVFEDKFTLQKAAQLLGISRQVSENPKVHDMAASTAKHLATAAAGYINSHNKEEWEKNKPKPKTKPGKPVKNNPDAGIRTRLRDDKVAIDSLKRLRARQWEAVGEDSFANMSGASGPAEGENSSSSPIDREKFKDDDIKEAFSDASEYPNEEQKRAEQAKMDSKISPKHGLQINNDPEMSAKYVAAAQDFGKAAVKHVKASKKASDASRPMYSDSQAAKAANAATHAARLHRYSKEALESIQNEAFYDSKHPNDDMDDSSQESYSGARKGMKTPQDDEEVKKMESIVQEVLGNKMSDFSAVKSKERTLSAPFGDDTDITKKIKTDPRITLKDKTKVFDDPDETVAIKRDKLEGIVNKFNRALYEAFSDSPLYGTTEVRAKEKNRMDSMFKRARKSDTDHSKYAHNSLAAERGEQAKINIGIATNHSPDEHTSDFYAGIAAHDATTAARFARYATLAKHKT